MAAVIIKVVEKWSVQSSIIYGYSHFNRRKIRDNMTDSEEGNVGCVMQF